MRRSEIERIFRDIREEMEWQLEGWERMEKSRVKSVIDRMHDFVDQLTTEYDNGDEDEPEDVDKWDDPLGLRD